jgi:hypothetical protein
LNFEFSCWPPWLEVHQPQEGAKPAIPRWTRGSLLDFRGGRWTMATATADG